MRTSDDTAIPDDLRAIVSARAGYPRKQRRLADNATDLARMAIEARRLARQAAILAEQLSAAAAECRKPELCPCGNPLPVRVTGRPPIYCDHNCGRAARKARSGASGQA